MTVLAGLSSFAIEVTLDDCADGPVPAQGCFAKTNAYVYDNEYNGRATNGADVASVDSALTVQIPAAFYDGNQVVTWTADNLQPSNIKQGNTVFGIAGTAGTSAPGATCTVDQGSAVNARCVLPNPPVSYVYAQDSGGRGQACVVTDPTGSGFTGQTGAPTPTPTPTPTGSPAPTPTPTPPYAAGPCWLADPGNRTVRTDAKTITCTKSGLVAKTCMVSSAYWYTSEYGGRSRVCTEGTNTQPCWLNATSAYAGVSTACKEDANNAGYNNASCKTAAASRYVYSSANGGRSANCLDDDQGYCWVTTSTKAGTATSLVAGNIRNGKTMFGVAGNYTGTPFSWGDGAHRAKSGTASGNRVTYTYESNSDGTGISSTTNLPSDYAPVPKISVATDAYQGSTIGPSQVTAVTRTGWSTTQCGTTGTLSARIANCATVFNAKGTGPTWDGTRYGNAGQFQWKLVTRTLVSGVNYEVWQDQATGLLWSSQVSAASGAGWCVASGNSNSTKVAADKAEVDPSHICDNSLYQSTGANNALSACYEGTGFSSTGTNQSGKAGLNMSLATTNGRVSWRLPTMYDYILANHHGLRFVLPDVGPAGEEWTATVYAKDRGKAWTFDGTTGTRQVRDRKWSYAVRCVGR